MSAEYLHYHAGGGNWDNGVYVKPLRGKLSTHGQPEEKACPPASRTWTPPKATCFRRASGDLKPTVTAITQTLRQGRLPVIITDLPESFFDPQDPFVIQSKGKVHGSHALVAVGLGTLAGDPLVLVRNSWGNDWADAGHAWLSSTFLDTHLTDAFELQGDLQP
ncbi:MAG: hypothetical protein LC623_04050 [Halobacteriales archaeon]|nr:hypothetical protein [Halobacteriales archaeon]